MNNTLLSKIQKLNIKIANYTLFDILGFLSRIILGIIFLLASSNKVMQVHAFEQNVAAYHILPQAILPIFSTVIPWIELFVGLYLILGFYIEIASFVSLFLLIMFMIAIAYAILTNQPVGNCGCFAQTASLERISWIDEVRDSVFLFLNIVIYVTHAKLLSLDAFLQKHKETSEKVSIQK